MQFENDVEMYGAQAISTSQPVISSFENDVEMYGAKAIHSSSGPSCLFENDVEMYGAQATILQSQNQQLFENDVEMYGAQAVRSPWPMQKERECRKYLRQNGYKTIDDVVKRQMKIPSKYRGNIYAYLFFGMED